MKLYLAGCVIKNRQGGVLLLHRNTPSRQEWELPGGKVEPGESSIAAAKRELFEELGVRVAVRRRLGEAKFERDGITFYYDWFYGVIEGGEPAVQEPNIHDECRYITLLELGRFPLSANLQKLYEELVAGRIKL